MTTDWNARRSRWAGDALAGYAAATGNNDFDRDAVVDLIADLGHWVDRNGIDFLPAISTAIANWLPESSASTPGASPPRVVVAATGAEASRPSGCLAATLDGA